MSTRLERCARWVPIWAVCVAATAPAVAADSGPYVTGDLGWASLPESVHWRLPATTDLSASGLHDHDVAWGFAVGYRFDRYVGLEAGYVDLGRLSGDIGDRSGATDARGNLSLSVKGETLSAVGTLPCGDWEGYLKTGVLFANMRLRAVGTDGARTFDDEASPQSGHLLLGLGVGYKIAPHWHAHLGLTGYFAVGGGESDGYRIKGVLVRELMLGIDYRF